MNLHTYVKQYLQQIVVLNFGPCNGAAGRPLLALSKSAISWFDKLPILLGFGLFAKYFDPASFAANLSSKGLVTSNATLAASFIC